MLIVNTYTAQSEIHGIGLFCAEEKIEKGRPIWVYKEGYDLKIKVNDIPEELRGYLDKYSTVSPEKDKILFKDGYQYVTYNDSLIYHLDGDNCKYMNHSDNPNVVFNDNIGIAIKDIELNEELTCDYSKITTKEHFEFLMLNKED